LYAIGGTNLLPCCSPYFLRDRSSDNGWRKKGRARTRPLVLQKNCRIRKGDEGGYCGFGFCQDIRRHFYLVEALFLHLDQDSHQLIPSILDRTYNKTDLPPFAGTRHYCRVELVRNNQHLPDNLADRILQLLVGLVVDKHHDIPPVTHQDLALGEVQKPLCIRIKKDDPSFGISCQDRIQHVHNLLWFPNGTCIQGFFSNAVVIQIQLEV